jgi:hypothetical protein
VVSFKLLVFGEEGGRNACSLFLFGRGGVHRKHGVFPPQSEIPGGRLHVEKAEDVGGFEDGFGCASAGGGENGSAKLLGSEDVLGKEFAEEEKERRADSVKSVVPGGFGFDAMHRNDGANAKHVRGFEGQAEDGVFGLTFDAGPHGTAFFGAVCAGAGDIEEGHLWIDSGERVRYGDGQIEVDVAIRGFPQASGGGSERKKTEVVAGHLIFVAGDVVKVGDDELLEFRVVLRERRAADSEDKFHDGVGKALAEDALADHSRCAEENYFHDCALRVSIQNNSKMRAGAAENGALSYHEGLGMVEELRVEREAGRTSDGEADVFGSGGDRNRFEVFGRSGGEKAFG